MCIDDGEVMEARRSVENWLSACQQWRSDRSAFACLRYTEDGSKYNTVHLDTEMHKAARVGDVVDGTSRVGPHSFDVEVAFASNGQPNVWINGMATILDENDERNLPEPIQNATSLAIAITNTEGVGLTQSVTTTVEFRRRGEVHAKATLGHPRSPSVGMSGASAVVLPYPLALTPLDESLFFKRIRWLEGFVARTERMQSPAPVDTDTLVNLTLDQMAKSRTAKSDEEQRQETEDARRRDVQDKIAAQFNQFKSQAPGLVSESISLSFSTADGPDAFRSIKLNAFAPQQAAAYATVVKRLLRLFYRSSAIRSTYSVLRAVVKMVMLPLLDGTEQPQVVEGDVAKLARALSSEPRRSKPLIELSEDDVDSRFVGTLQANRVVLLPVLARGFAAHANAANAFGTMDMRWGDYGGEASSRLGAFRCVRLLQASNAVAINVSDYSNVRNALLGMACSMAYPPRAVRRAASSKAPSPQSSTMPPTAQRTWEPPKHFMRSLGLDPTEPHHLAAFLGFCDLLVLEQLRGASSANHRFARLFDTAIASAQGMAMAAADLIDAMVDRQTGFPALFGDDPVFVSNAGRAARVVLHHHPMQGGSQFVGDDATRGLSTALRRLAAQRKLLIHPSRWPVTAVQTLAMHRDTSVSSPDSLLDLQLHMANVRITQGLYDAPLVDLQIGAAIEAFKRMRVFREPESSAEPFLKRTLQLRPGVWIPLIEYGETWWQNLVQDLDGGAVGEEEGGTSIAPIAPKVAASKAIMSGAILPFWRGRLVPTKHGQTACEITDISDVLQHTSISNVLKLDGGCRFRAGLGEYTFSFPTREYNASFADTPIHTSLARTALVDLTSTTVPPNVLTFTLSASPQGNTQAGLDLHDLTVRKVDEGKYQLDAWLCIRSEPMISSAANREDDSTQYMLWDVDRVAQLMSVAAAVVTELTPEKEADEPTLFQLEITGIEPNYAPYRRWWMTCALASIVSQRNTYGTAVKPALVLTSSGVDATDQIARAKDVVMSLMPQKGNIEIPLAEVVNALLVSERVSNGSQ